MRRRSEALIPGRAAEARASSAKELAATLVIALEITVDNWLFKVRTGWSSDPRSAEADPNTWTGIVPKRSTYAAPVPSPWAQSLPMPPSVRRLSALTSADQPTAGSGVR